MRIPKEEKKLIEFAKEQIQICGVSQGNRGAAYQQYSQFIETGRDGGGLSLANTLYAHVDRLASHLFCPTDARFSIDFENVYPKTILNQAEHAARTLTRAFNRNKFDTAFSGAVAQSLAYGASFIKLTGKAKVSEIGGKTITHIDSAGARIVPPWLLGVENESKADLDDQEAFCETVYQNKYDVWRRIARMPDADTIYKKILGSSSKTSGPALPSSFVQVLSTSVLSLNPQGSNPPNPGGVIQIAGNPSYATTGPQLIVDQYPMQELWCWDDDREDWLMIQFMEPNILISPRYKRVNEFCKGNHPYVKVQPNETPGYFWGRSEIVDVLMLQTALSETMDDFRRIIGAQYDGRYAFEGFDGDPAELYDDMRQNGYVNGRAGAKVNNLTPNLPAGALEYIKLIRTMMEDVSGFGNILSGQGEAGVRAGNHAATLVKTASPRLRDRSLIVERNYATLGDTYLAYMEAKDGNQYHYDPEKPDESAYLLSQLPEDRRVMVDSHSTSPIYENDHNNLVSFGLKAGLIGGDDAIEMLNFPNRDELKRKYQENQKQKAEQMAAALKEDPTLFLRGTRRGGR